MTARPFTKPAALRPGATLAVISPASTPKRELVERGVAELEALGYRCQAGQVMRLASGPLYYAGSLAERLKDLHAAFADPDRSMESFVLAAAGVRRNCCRIWMRTLIRANPKAFIGYSDHTSLHSWFQNEANLTSFYAPMVAADFAREEGVDLASWRNTFGGEDALVARSDRWPACAAAGSCGG